MAKAKFEKNSYYWRLFMDFWNLCQDYWVLEDTDEWWEEVDRKCKEFIAKYDEKLFARGLCGALISHLEEVKKGM